MAAELLETAGDGDPHQVVWSELLRLSKRYQRRFVIAGLVAASSARALRATEKSEHTIAMMAHQRMKAQSQGLSIRFGRGLATGLAALVVVDAG